MSETPVLMLARSESYDSSIQITPRTPRVTREDVTRSAENLLMTLAGASPPSSPNIKRPNIKRQDYKGPYYECIALRNENEVLKKKIKELEKQQNTRCKIVKEASKLISVINSLNKECKKLTFRTRTLNNRIKVLEQEKNALELNYAGAMNEVNEQTNVIASLLSSGFDKIISNRDEE